MTSSALLSPPPVDAGSFWRTLGQRAVGVSIVTAQGPDGPAGFLGLSATHVTSDPPTMLVSVDKRTSALSAILSAGHFAVNYLAGDTVATAEAFAGKTDAKGSERFLPSDWTILKTGAPIHSGALGAFDCEVVETLERYGVVLVIGRVVAVGSHADADPLIYFRGSYLT